MERVERRSLDLRGRGGFVYDQRDLYHSFGRSRAGDWDVHIAPGFVGDHDAVLAIIAAWHETYEFLTTDVILVLMISPFILPLVQFAGYMQGPKLWKKTEQAMVDGRRRAKARSRIVKKNKLPRSMRPEI